MGKRVAILLVALVTSLLHTLLYLNFDWDTRFEPYSMELWFNIRGQIPPPEDIVIVAIDEQSYIQLDLPMGKAWPRYLQADLLRRLADAGEKRVVFDVLFVDASGDKEADAELAEALSLLPTTIGADTAIAAGSIKIESLILPYQPFLETAHSIALVGLPKDEGYVRRFKTVRTNLARDYPTLSEAGAGINQDERKLPDKQDFINFYGPADTITTYSYYDVLDPDTSDEKLKDQFKDKIVYVGLMLKTDLGPIQKDSFMTPFWKGGIIFGVEIHATAAGNLMEGKWIRRSDKLQEALILGILAFIVTFALFTLRPHWAGLTLIVFGVGWACSAFTYFLDGFFLPGFILVIFILPVMYLISTLYYYFVTSKAQRQTQKAFEFYLSPEMARAAGKNPKSLDLGGENIYATAIFTDIIDFTKITEKMVADDVAAMLNSYFTEVMEVVFENEGTLIKFIGDSIFAIWGAPIKIGDHADKAVQSAISIDQKVREFNASGNFPELKTKIGVHTGQMVIGNLGSKRRFDYTAIGDSVNLAARLEGINKYFGTSFLFSEVTKKELKNNHNTCKICLVNVAGKSDAVGIYTVLPDSTPEAISDKWSTALHEFNSQSWDEASEIFKSIAGTEEFLKGAAEFYISQISHLKSNPPDEEWSGQIVFDTK